MGKDNLKDRRARREAKKEVFVKEFSERIRLLRVQRFGEERGSKSAAAEAIGVTPADWRGYENGVIPGADKIQQICSMFGCDANWLLGLKSSSEGGLTQPQRKFIDSLTEMHSVVVAFDGMFTDCLMNLKNVLADPEIAQAQCFKLYAIAHKLALLREEVEKGGGA